MSDPEPDLPLDDFINGSRKPDGIDLADMEAAQRRLAAERDAVVKRTYLVPGKKKALLEEMDNKAGPLGTAIIVTREHVRADPIQSKIYAQRNAEYIAKEKAEAAEKTRDVKKSRSVGKASGAEPDPTDD